MLTRRILLLSALLPLRTATRRDRARVIRELLEFGRGRKLGGMRIRDLIEEGRRF